MHVRLLAAQARHLLESWYRRAPRAHLLRYEDLVRHPAASLRTVFGYLGLHVSEWTIQRMFERASVETPETLGHRTVLDPSASIGRWRSDLDPRTRALCNEVFREVLEGFGYPRG